MKMGSAKLKPWKGLTLSGWLTLAVLIGVLIAAVFYSVKAWNAMSGVQVSGFGWFSLIMGVIVTFGLGSGLMGLVFYSSRHDLDR